MDYTSQHISVAFSPDESEKTIRVPIIDDSLRECSETFYGYLRISPISAHIARVTTARATIEISYNDCNYYNWYLYNYNENNKDQFHISLLNLGNCNCTTADANSCLCDSVGGYFGNGFLCDSGYFGNGFVCPGLCILYYSCINIYHQLPACCCLQMMMNARMDCITVT